MFESRHGKFPFLFPAVKLMRTSIISIALFVILSFSSARAANVIAVASGNWSSAATWGGALPGVEDTVKIPTGLTVTLNANKNDREVPAVRTRTHGYVLI